MSWPETWVRNPVLCGCLFVWLVLLVHCKPLPLCTVDADCAPLRCVQGQCLADEGEPAVEDADGSERSGADGIDTGREESVARDGRGGEGVTEVFVEVGRDAREGVEEPDGGVERPEGQGESAGDAGSEGVGLELGERESLRESPPEPSRESPPEPSRESPPEPSREGLVWDSFVRCGGAWVSSLTDEKHCGGCGKVCPAGQRCCAGRCGVGSVEVCNGKDDDCDGVIDEGMTGCVLTYAGVPLHLEGPALWTPLSGPMGLALDAAGHLYIAERNRFRVRKLDPSGILTTLAGSGRYSFAGPGAPGVKTDPLVAGFQGPTSMAWEPKSNVLFTAQSSAPHFWRIPLPGSGNDLRLSGDLLPTPLIDLCFDSLGVLYLLALPTARIFTYDIQTRKATLFAGANQGYFDGPRLQARFNRPTGLLVDPKGQVFIADHGNLRIRKIDKQGNVTTFAGSGMAGSINGVGIRASFGGPRHMAMDKAGNLYVADARNHQIRKVTPAAEVSLFAGGFPGRKDGPALQASFFWPTGLAYDSLGRFFVSDTGNNTIRMISPAGDVTTVAGAVHRRGGALHQVQLNEPRGLVFDKAGNLYVADSENQRILRFAPSGQHDVFWGNGAQPALRYGLVVRAPGLLPVMPSHLWHPRGMDIDAQGNLAIAETETHQILRVSPAGKVFMWGLLPTSRDVDGPLDKASFDSPQDVAFASAGTLVVADTGNHKLRLIDANDAVSTLAGNGSAGFADGDVKIARLDTPVGLLVEQARNRVFIADQGNHRIRVYDFTTRMLSTFAGGRAGYRDADAANARFHAPSGLAWGPSRKAIYIADRDNHCVRKLELNADGSAGAVSTVVGSGFSGRLGGPPRQAQLHAPTALVWGPKGALYISDTANHLLRVYRP